MNQEQTEEVLFRIKRICPTLAANPDFCFAVCQIGSSEDLIPIAYPKEYESEGNALPQKYLMIIKQTDDKFILFFREFFLLSGVGWPLTCWPERVAEADLDRVIAEIWESWKKIIESYQRSLDAYLPKIDPPQPL